MGLNLLGTGLRAISGIFIVVLVLFASLVTAGRLFMPHLGAYQEGLLNQLNSRAVLQLNVEGMEGEWRGLSPVIRLRNLRLRNPQGELVVEAGHVLVYFDLLKSILYRKPLAHTVSIVNARVELEQTARNTIGLRGVPLEEAGARSGIKILSFLKQVDLLEINQLRVEAQTLDRTVLVFDSLSGALRQGLYLSQLNLEMFDRHRRQPSLRLHAEFAGWLDDPRLARGFLSLDELEWERFDPLLASWSGKIPPVLSGQFWFGWRAGKGWQTQGHLGAPVWPLEGLVGPAVPALKSVALKFAVSGSAGGYVRGRVLDLNFVWHGARYELGDGLFNAKPDWNALYLRLSSLGIDTMVQGGRNSGLLPAALEQALSTLNPAGEMRDIHLNLPLRRESVDEFRLRATLVDGSVSAWKGAPGARSVDGYLEAGLREGFVDLDGSALELEFPSIYDHVLHFESTLARVGWRLDDRLRVSSGLIKAGGDFGAATAQLELDIPLQGKQAETPSMSLVVGIQHSDARHRDLFLPKFLGRKLLDWLAQSVREAEVEQVGFIYHGSLKQIEPMDKTVQLFLDVRDGRLRYLPRWPELNNVDAQVVLSNDDLTATATRAALLQSRIGDVKLELSRQAGVGWLGISGNVAGAAQDIVTLLDESPLRTATGGALHAWRAEGTYSGQLDLNIPLAAHLRPVVAAQGRLKRVRLRNRDLGIEFSETHGEVSYSTARGLVARRLRSRLWDEPLQVAIGAGPRDANGQRPLVVKTRGLIAVDRVQRWLGQPGLGLASGRSEVFGTLTIPPAGGQQTPTLYLNSDLEGIALDLPTPFVKRAADRRSSQLRLDLADGVVQGEMRYTNLLRARFHGGKRRDLRAGIWLGSVRKPELPARGVRISGQLDRMVLREWLQTIEVYRTLVGSSRSSGDSALRVENLMVREVDAFGQLLKRPTIDLGLVDRRWQLDLRHPRIGGRMRFPRGGQALELELDHLRFPLDASETPSQSRLGSALSAVNPAKLPKIRVSVQQVALGDRALGRWQFSLNPSPMGVDITGLKVTIGDAQFGGIEAGNAGAVMNWNFDGEVHRTALRGMLRAGDVDELLRSIGYQAGIVSDSAEVIVDLDWSGPPDAMALPVINGHLYLTLKDGQLLQTAGTPADALRLLGILNVNYLARRMRLDFSDLYQSGISYDKLSGILRFDQGALNLQQGLRVDGPSSKLKLSGSFDLQSGAIDADLVVAVPLTSNLPWVVALTLPGGLPIAAGVYVAGKVFEKQLQTLTSAVYSLSGTVEDPQVAFRHISDAGNTAQERPIKLRRSRAATRK